MAREAIETACEAVGDLADHMGKHGAYSGTRAGRLQYAVTVGELREAAWHAVHAMHKTGTVGHIEDARHRGIVQFEMLDAVLTLRAQLADRVEWWTANVSDKALEAAEASLRDSFGKFGDIWCALVWDALMVSDLLDETRQTGDGESFTHLPHAMTIVLHRSSGDSVNVSGTEWEYRQALADLTIEAEAWELADSYVMVVDPGDPNGDPMTLGDYIGSGGDLDRLRDEAEASGNVELVATLDSL